MSPTYTLRVDGKYDLVRWQDGWDPGLSWRLWYAGILMVGTTPCIVDKWIKCYRGRTLVSTNKVPDDAAERRENIGKRRCCR